MLVVFEIGVVGDELVALFYAHYSCVGVEKMHALMKKPGWKNLGRDQVRRLMRAHNICGMTRGRTKIITTIAGKNQSPTDLVKRLFKMDKPNKLWVGGHDLGSS